MFDFIKKFFEPKPFNEGYLPEQDGHKVYFMEIGNPAGKAVISFHGGPGGSSRVKHAQMFNLKRYRIILFDQRGGGKSLPSGEMKHNNVDKIIGDAKRLLDHLNIKGKIVVSGSSWGSTMALLFAEKYPKVVSKLIVSKIFFANKDNKKWIYETSGLFYPDMLERIKSDMSIEDMLKHYAKLINSKDMLDQVKAVTLLGGYENLMGSFNPSLEFREVSADSIAYSKIFINYEDKDFTIKENQILKNIDDIKNIKTLIVHNRLDMVCPVKNAYDLHKVMPKSKLVIVPSCGHGSQLLSDTLKTEIEKFLK